MSRYINAEWLLNFFEPYSNDYQTPLGLLRACVDDAPSIDIVRCKECRWWLKNLTEDDEDEAYLHCPIEDGKPDDFCSYGEREGE